MFEMNRVASQIIWHSRICSAIPNTQLFYSWFQGLEGPLPRLVVDGAWRFKGQHSRTAGKRNRTGRPQRAHFAHVMCLLYIYICYPLNSLPFLPVKSALECLEGIRPIIASIYKYIVPPQDQWLLMVTCMYMHITSCAYVLCICIQQCT